MPEPSSEPGEVVSNPSETQQFGAASTGDVQRLLQRMMQEIEMLRAQVTVAEQPRSRSGSASSVLHTGVEATQAESLKMHSIVATIEAPGGAWEGYADRRPIHSFLAGVARRATLYGLNSEGLFKFIIQKCLSPRLSDDLCDVVQGCIQTRDYTRANVMAEEYLQRRFAHTNCVDRTLSLLEQGTWAIDCRSIDDYSSSFNAALRTASALGASIDRSVARRYFLAALPAAWKDRVKNFCSLRMDVEEICGHLSEYLQQCESVGRITPTAPAMPKRLAPVMEQDGEGMATQAGPGTPHGDRVCFGCGQPGHMRRECPSAGEGGRREPKRISWRTKVVRVKAAAADAEEEDISPGAVVKLTSASGQVGSIETRALLDSGSSRTLISQRLADELYSSGLVLEEDIKHGESAGTIEFVMANGHVEKPLGCIRIRIDGHAATAYVLSGLSPDLICGIDTLHSCEELLHQLVASVSGKGLEYAKQLCARIRAQRERGSRPDPGRIAAAPAPMVAVCQPMAEGTPEVKETTLPVAVIAEADGVALGASFDSQAADSGKLEPVTMGATGSSSPVGEAVGAVSLQIEPIIPEVELDRGGPAGEGETDGTPTQARVEPSMGMARGPPVGVPHQARVETVALQWVSDARPPDNRRQIKFESARMEGRLAPELRESYRSLFREWADKGWIRRVGEDAVSAGLRHFCIPKKSGGARLLIDGSTVSPYLADFGCSHKYMIDNLLLLRTCDIFSTTDLSSAFNRIPLSQEDARHLAIWHEQEWFVFCGMPQGIKTSPGVLQALVDQYVTEFESTPISSQWLTRILPHMDDLILAGWSQAEAPPGPSERAAMEQRVTDELADYLRCEGMEIASDKSLNSARAGMILGLHYSPESGLTVGQGLELPSRDRTVKFTRRQAASLLSSLFDPLGLVAELVTSARLIMRDCSGFPWGGLLSRALCDRVADWVECARATLPVSSPRKLDFRELVVITDASADAIGLIVAAKDEAGRWQRAFGKSQLYKPHQRAWRANGVKTELLGIQAGVHVAQHICKLLAPMGIVPSITFLSDSECNVQRLSENESRDTIRDRWQRLVISEVGNVMFKSGWRMSHVAGVMNSADVVSRGLLASSPVPLDECIMSVQPEKLFIPGPSPRFVVEEKEGERDGGQNDQNQSPNRVVVAAAVRRPRATETLLQRFQRESGESGGSIQRWLAGYQAKDGWVQDMVKSRRAALNANGVYVRLGMQHVDGSSETPTLLPADLVPNVLFSEHGGNHLGFRATLGEVRREFVWRGMNRDIKNYVNHCPTCSQIKSSRIWSTAPKSLWVDGRAWACISIDVVKGYQEGHCLLCVVDCFSKYIFVEWTRSEAVGAILKFMRRLWRDEGNPLCIVSDNAMVFNSAEWKNELQCRGIVHRQGPVYAGYYYGWYERIHGILTQSVKALRMQCKEPLSQIVMQAASVINLRPLSDSNPRITPFSVFKGREPFGSLDQLAIPDGIMETTEEQFHDILGQRKEERLQIINDYLKIWEERRLNSYDQMTRKPVRIRDWLVGDQVRVWRDRLTRSKLDPCWGSLGEIVSKVSDSVFIVEDETGRRSREHAHNLKLVSPEADDRVAGAGGAFVGVAANESMVEPVRVGPPVEPHELVSAPPRRSDRLRRKREAAPEPVSKRIRVSSVSSRGILLWI